MPSIIYGIWGLFVLAPLLQRHVQPWLIDTLGSAGRRRAALPGPALRHRRADRRLVLAIMVLPFISSVMRDVFETVPDVLKESAYGLGATTWEVIWKVVVPYSRTGMIGGIMLGLGRALGETMAVTFVIGNAHRISASLLAPGTTISAAIANEFTEAVGDLYTSSLIALGVLLFLITFAVIAAARFMLLRLERARAVVRMNRRAASASSPMSWRSGCRRLATAVGLSFLGAILWTLLSRTASPACRWPLFTADDAAAGQRRRAPERDLRQRRHDAARHS